jgi:hypothetical protein
MRIVPDQNLKSNFRSCLRKTFWYKLASFENDSERCSKGKGLDPPVFRLKDQPLLAPLPPLPNLFSSDSSLCSSLAEYHLTTIQKNVRCFHSSLSSLLPSHKPLQYYCWLLELSPMYLPNLINHLQLLLLSLCCLQRHLWKTHPSTNLSCCSCLVFFCFSSFSLFRPLITVFLCFLSFHSNRLIDQSEMLIGFFLFFFCMELLFLFTIIHSRNKKIMKLRDTWLRMNDECNVPIEQDNPYKRQGCQSKSQPRVPLQVDRSLSKLFRKHSEVALRSWFWNHRIP